MARLGTGHVTPLLAERFRLSRKIGSGGFGDVYEAYDGDRSQPVALKVLQKLDPKSLFRFKREFRVLADITHENLVRLGELFSADELWFFTMELVHGTTFLEYVNRSGPRSTEPTAETLSFDDSREARGPERAPARPELGRLRAAMGQLARGVATLHRAGKLHRDLKPSNVLVTPEGRVVILDLGMVAEVDDGGLCESAEHRVGTPAYMAPEQAAGRPVSAAGDWYAVGVMLYEALVDRLPFSGGASHVMLAKQLGDGPDPRAVDASLPEDLSALCHCLLRLDPETRPSEADILDVVDRPSADQRSTSSGAAPKQDDGPSSADTPLIGRERHLAVLRNALATVAGGQMAVVFVTGASGIGKSTLMKHFVDGVRHRRDAIILEGRCYERESVPYNALDAVIDALSTELARLDPLVAAKLTPRHLTELCCVFPVLRRVPSFSDDAALTSRLVDPQEVRQRAFSALKELLVKMAERRPVILYVDDLQWGDLDSGVALGQIFEPPEPPALLFVGSHRSDGDEQGPLLKFLREYTERATWLHVESLEVEPLDGGDARALVASVAKAEEGRIDAIVREAGGHPYFVAELARAGAAASQVGSLAELIRGRVEALSPRARAVLETVVVAARPLPRSVTTRATGDADDGDAIAALVGARLLRTSGRGAPTLETYHDRIRETVRTAISPERAKELHLALATALEAIAGTPAHVLSQHFSEGGMRDKALHFSRAAADEAVRTLAFDRAADLYRVAVQHAPEDDDGARGALYRLLGDALANAGRGVEAADSYLRASEFDDENALDLQRRAATALLVAGHVDRGLDVGSAVLTRLGLSMPRSPRVAYWMALLRFAWFVVRGVGFKERKAGEIDERDLRQLDTLFALGMGLSLTDAMRSLYFTTLFVLSALRIGEPMRVGFAMMGAVMWFSALMGPRSRSARRWLDLHWALAGRLGSARLRGSAALTEGFRRFSRGDWSLARDRFAEAERNLVEESDGASWEISNARVYYCWALYHTGDVRELSTRAPALVELGKRRDDLSLWCRASSASATVGWLVRDDVGGARRAANEALQRWPSGQPFGVIHHWQMISWRFIHLYDGEAAELYEHVTSRWSALRAAGLLRLRFVRQVILLNRAVAALALADVRPGGSERDGLLDEARRYAEMLPPLGVGGGIPFADLVRAGVANARGDRPAAAILLRDAAAGFDSAGMKLHAAVARSRLGAVVGGDEGKEAAAAGDVFMRQQTIVKPERFVEMLAPGFAR